MSNLVMINQDKFKNISTERMNLPVMILQLGYL